ncbi:unnamed protein product [Paramecium pentaurelia]|uniref:Uncharacterized protein n=1 Tax=Paramecium pentaurelia TaxID=43138 RepID=A0A8S1XAP2_9CILI|nr:unnamed protein product [Paramecium pentaurelia]
MKQLIVKLIIVTLVASQQVILFATSFTDKKFTSLENWSLYPQNPLKSGYGSLTSEDDDYAGFYSIIGVSMRSYLNGIYKIFENIPPHSSLIIKAKTLIQNFGLGGLGIVHIRVDGKLVTRFQSEFDQDNHQKIHSSEIFFISSSSSVIIEFHFEGVGYYKDMTFGFREFHLYYRKCPDGCLYCQTLDSNQNHCNFWFQDHHSLHDSNSLNDGWTIIKNDQRLYQMEYCRDDKALNLLGIILPNEAFEKTLHLAPHHKILIQYKQLLLGADFFSAAYWSLELNDVTVKEIPFFTYHRTSQLCKHNNPSSLGDYITQVIYEDFHYNTIVKLRIFTQGRIFFQKLKWTIRDFEVYIQKCHPDCTESCFGPRANQCSRQKYPEFKNFVSYFTEPLFTDTQEWQMITPIQPKSPNYCNGVSIFGGYLQLGGDHYIQRFITLKDHQTIQISFKFYQIDNFNNDILYVVVDDQIVYQTVLEPIIDIQKATPLCGIYENYDLIVKISTPIIQHTQKQKILSLNKIQQYIYKNQNKLDF